MQDRLFSENPAVMASWDRQVREAAETYRARSTAVLKRAARHCDYQRKKPLASAAQILAQVADTSIRLALYARGEPPCDRIRDCFSLAVYLVEVRGKRTPDRGNVAPEIPAHIHALIAQRRHEEALEALSRWALASG